MKITITYFLIAIGFFFTGCDNAEISKVAPIKNEPNSNSSFVPPQFKQVDTSAIINLIHFHESQRLEHGTTPELETKIQLLKDSIGDKMIRPTIGKPVKLGDFKKIPTH